METLSNLECFVKSAELASFSEAARQLGLTPAAVSRNVGALEANLGVRLFQRSTRRLYLTEAGERFLESIGPSLDTLQHAIRDAAAGNDEPSGTLKVSLSPTLGLLHVMPHLPAFLQRYPRVVPEWHFDSRPVDLVAEGYDAAIGGGFDLSPGVVARPIGPAHIVPVASPGYLAGRTAPIGPADLAEHDGIVIRSSGSGRIKRWQVRDRTGNEERLLLRETIIVDEPLAMMTAARLGLGIAMLAVADIVEDLAAGTLVRVLPDWYADAGTISLYYPSRTMLPAKTRAFVEFYLERFEAAQTVNRFSAVAGSNE